MKVEYAPINEIKPYENNPRLNDQAVDAVAASIKAFGWRQPIVVDRNGVIVAGHTRYKAAVKMGLDKVPVERADDLTEEQVKAYRLADNKTAELALWDFGKLQQELDDIELDMTEFGFDATTEFEGIEEAENEFDGDDDKYTDKRDALLYEPNIEGAGLLELVDTAKYDTLIQAIATSGVTEEEKSFLYRAAARHLVFNYARIADYYAVNADAEMQQLMRDSALVIIDYNDAVKNGYAVLRQKIKDLMRADTDEA